MRQGSREPQANPPSAHGTHTRAGRDFGIRLLDLVKFGYDVVAAMPSG